MKFPTRLNLLLKIRNITIFAMISATQTLEGVMSKIGNDKHLILADIETDKPLNEILHVLKRIQRRYRLGDFWLTSDFKGSYRLWCFSQRSWLKYLQILLDLLKEGILDYNFWFWTIKRGSATLRTSNKANREPQRVIAHLKGYEKTTIPSKLCHVVYDTGTSKVGWCILLKDGRLSLIGKRAEIYG
ncbi:MAG: hypothetical protein ACUVTB_06800 [Candidatus Bathycorpusculaceae bacterium]